MLKLRNENKTNGDGATTISKTSSNRLVYLLLILAGIASAPLQLITDRPDYDTAILNIEEVYHKYSAGFTWLNRLFNAIFAVIFLLLIKIVVKSGVSVTAGVYNLIFALGLFTIFNYGIGSIFGTYPGLPKFYFILTYLSLMLMALIKDISPQKLVEVFKFVTFFMLAGSILMGVFFPQISYSYFLDSELSEKRLVGFFTSPRQIGIYALMLFLVELRLGVKAWQHEIILLICIIALLMSISKTAIFLAALSLLWHISTKGGIRLILIIFLLFAFMDYMLLNPEFLSAYESNENFVTMTGRTSIWITILKGWFANPLFGNGPALFLEPKLHNLPAHAHNLFIQSLSDGGLFGLIGLTVYLMTLISIAFKNRFASNFTSIGLVLLLIAFSFTEPITRIDDFVNGSFFINTFIILYLCALDRQRISSKKFFNQSQLNR